MKLKNLLQLQLSYCLLGIGYNIASQINLEIYGQALTRTYPLEGLIAMTVYAIFLLPALFGKIHIYRGLMVLALIIFAYGGIVVHVLSYANDPSSYFSSALLFIGVGINTFGLLLNVYAALFAGNAAQLDAS